MIKEGKGPARSFRSMQPNASPAPIPPRCPGRYAVFLSCCAAVNSIVLGYDIGVMSGAILFIRDGLALSTHETQAILGCFNACAVVGALCAGRLSNGLGRTRTLAAASLFFCIGNGLMALSSSFSGLLFGRMIAGLGSGFGLSIDPMYISETAPARFRGALITIFCETAINIGIISGVLASFAFSFLPDADLAWRLMLLLGAIAPLLEIVLALCIMPETPRWLVRHGRDVEALRILRRLVGNELEAQQTLLDIRGDVKTGLLRADTDAEGGFSLRGCCGPEPPALSGRMERGGGEERGLALVEVSSNAATAVDPVDGDADADAGAGGAGIASVDAMPGGEEMGSELVSIDLDARVDSSGNDGDDSNDSNDGTISVRRRCATLRRFAAQEKRSCCGWRGLLSLRTRGELTMLGTGLAVAILQQTGGVETLMYYAPIVFQLAGIQGRSGSLAMTLAMQSLKTACIVIAALGVDKLGRRPLLVASNCGMAIALVGTALGFWYNVQILSIGGIFVFLGVFSLGMGPCCWLYISEIFPLEIRANGTTLATAANRAAAALTSATFLSLIDLVGSTGNAFLFYAFLNALAAVFFFTCLPETKGRPIETMREIFAVKAASSARLIQRAANVCRCRENPNPNRGGGAFSSQLVDVDDEEAEEEARAEQKSVGS